jgi:hypothetical protein
MPTARRWSLGLALMMLTSLAATPAFAQIDKCQSGLAKNSQKLETQLAKGFEKCLAAIRKGVIKGKPAAEGAASCEKTIDKLLGLGVVPPAKSKIGKFLAAVQKLVDQGKCSAAELAELGHLVSGVNAPGTLPTDFMASWMAAVKQRMAWSEQVIDNGDARDLLDLALSAGPAFDDPSECDSSTGKGCGTDCDGAVPAGYVSRPNLCNLRYDQWPECRVHACQLETAGATIQPAGAPINFTTSKFALEVCRVPSTVLPVSGADFVFLSAGGTRTFSPPPTIPTVPAMTWCIDQVRAEGWCDCSGESIPFSPQSCLDHIADAGGTCPDTGATPETDCVCADLVGQPPCSTADCNVCVHAKTGVACHPGAENSAVNTTYTGTSASGDCLYLATLQYKYLWSGTCVNAAGEPLAPCHPVGPAPAACAAIGGTSCVNSLGADGLACTSDDISPPEATVTIPLTTGTAQATIENRVNTQGLCVTPASQVGKNCITDADCDSIVGMDGTCNAFNPGCATGPDPEDCRHTIGPGAGLSCGRLESSNLSGFTLVGAVPTLHVPIGLNTYGFDYNMTFRVDCE